jgi:DNA repair protein RadC
MKEDKRRQSIKNWSEDDRPREKMMLKGKASLSDAELIAILIASGTKDESAVDLSKRILKSVNNNLIELSKLNVNDLKKFKGIGQAKAITIVSALELGNILE